MSRTDFFKRVEEGYANLHNVCMSMNISYYEIDSSKEKWNHYQMEAYNRIIQFIEKK